MCFFFFKQKTAYEMRISDWSSDVCSSDLFHIRPINVVVFHGSMITYLEGGFPLRCFQRLSRPYIATLLPRWHDDRSTRGMFTPVLSYSGQLLSIIDAHGKIGRASCRERGCP